MNGKKWFCSIIIMLAATLLIFSGCVFWADPFFHYRKPKDYLYYELIDQRFQNDGITKHFDYDSIITGTSMCENFLTSEFDELFGTNSIKVCYSGATYKEINDNLKVAYNSGHSPKFVLRGLDYTLLVRDKDALRLDMGEYPDYLTNRNPFDDVKYLVNKDVLINYTLPVFAKLIKGEPGGHTSFDVYSYTADNAYYNKDAVLMDRYEFNAPEVINEATEAELTMLSENMTENVVELASGHPETTFLYFFPPYSMAYFGGVREEGNLEKELLFKEKAIDMMLEHENIHIYSFTDALDITTDLDKYRDVAHYNQDVSYWIIEQIADGEGFADGTFTGNENPGYRITKENKDAFLAAEKEILESFDYNSLLTDED